MKIQIKRLNSFLAIGLMVVFAVGAKPQPAYAAPFTCEPGFFQSMIFGSLKKLNTSDGTYEDIGTSSAALNAIGYNVLDNYIYGINNDINDTLVRIEHDATTTDLGAPAGFANGNYVAGDMDHSGNLYVTDSTTLWKINVSALTATSVALSTVTGANDLVFIDGYLYGTNGTSLYQIDVDDGTVVTKALGLTAGVYGAGWATVEGKMYFGQNVNGIIYEILDFDGPSPQGVPAFAGVGSLAGNDGASCSLAASVIEPINAVDDTASTPIGTPLTVSAENGLLTNDTPDNVTVDSYTQPAHGSVVVNPDGSYTYTPAPGFVGTDSFTYTIINSVGETATATVYITVSDPTVTSSTPSTPAEPGGLASTGESSLMLVSMILLMMVLSIFGLRRSLRGEA